MSNYKTIICVGKTEIYQVPELRNFLKESLISAGGFFVGRYSREAAVHYKELTKNSNCENSKFLIASLEAAKEFVVYSEEIAEEFSNETFIALLEHEKAHLDNKDQFLDPETYFANIDSIELKADEGAAKVVGKEVMKKALLEVIKMSVKTLMENNPNNRSFEENMERVKNSDHFRKRLDALS